MIAKELRSKLGDLLYTAAMNQLYHQRKASFWWTWDKVVKSTVGLLAVFALVTTFVPEGWKAIEWIAASLAAVAAIILNVAPVGEWEAHFSELFRGWSDLRVCGEQLRFRIQELPDDEKVPHLLMERYAELLGQQHQLNSEEWAPNEELILRCQGDLNESIYGSGNRTYAQVMESMRGQQQETTHPVVAEEAEGE